MLVELAVRDLGVIRELRVVLGPGMTALTGETGAGKTLVVEALDLLLGGRAEGALVRTGAAEATVEGRFVVDGEELVLRRAVPASGRSRAYVDGRMATAAELSEVGRDLVDLHGQHAHQSLLAPAVQRDALDRYGGIDPAPLAAARAEEAAIAARLEALGGDRGARERELDLLRFQLDELDAARLVEPDEDDRLDEEQDELAAVTADREAAAEALAALSADGPVHDGIGRARAALDGSRRFASLAERVRSVEAEVADIGAEVRGAGEAVEERPERLAEIRARRQLLRDLVRKYGTASGHGDGGPGSLGSVLDYREEIRARLAELQGDEVTVARLEQERDRARRAVAAEQARVGAARRAAAPGLAAAVEDELRELAMPRARVEVEVGADPGDRVAVLLAANPGAEPRPLAKVASGGELARAMLAVRLVLTAGPPVLVFDEVDAGVGGAAAAAVGRALARVATDHQVLVVTHLAQVAACADAQVVVTKHQEGEETTSELAPVDGRARVTELARMLSGSPDAAVAREHAGELLADAERDRAGRGRRRVREGV